MPRRSKLSFLLNIKPPKTSSVKRKQTKHVFGCGTVALYGPLYKYIFFFAETIGLRFSLVKNFRHCAKKILRRFFDNFCHEIGCENDQTYIFRFVRYLSTFFYTYLPMSTR
jgi:hypothetical protein